MKRLLIAILALMPLISLATPSSTAPSVDAPVINYVAPTPGDLFGNSPKFPSIYSDGLTRLQVANLTSQEQAVYAEFEALMQTTEAYVQAYGCNSNTGDLTVFSDSTGKGDLSLTTLGGQLNLTVFKDATDPFRGNHYRVTGLTGSIAGKDFVGVFGDYGYNKNSSVMVGIAVMNVPNPTANNALDLFSGGVIKDFYTYPVTYQGIKRTAFLDWGLQVLTKKHYPIAKWWQRSYAFREDGIEAITHFQKIRIAGGTACAIDIDTAGNNNPDEFYQTGTFKIAPVTGSLVPLQ
jgi:hypothetical protein